MTNEKLNYKNKGEGKYFDTMFETAVTSSPDTIGITSFNEWHEGRQIEPAIPKSIKNLNMRIINLKISTIILKKQKYGQSVLLNKYITLKSATVFHYI